MYMYSNHLLTAAISNQTIMENGHEPNYNVTPSDRKFFTRVELKNLVRLCSRDCVVKQSPFSPESL